MTKILTTMQLNEAVNLLTILVGYREQLVSPIQLAHVEAGGGTDFLSLTPEGLVVHESRPETDYSDHSADEEIVHPSWDVVKHFDLELEKLRKLLLRLQAK